MNRTLFAAGAVLALGAPLAGIVQKELLLAKGRPVILELAPVDPRSLMQGDYMALNYAVGRGIQEGPRNGFLVLKNDARGVGRLVRVDDGSPLAGDEYRIRFRNRRWRTSIGGNSYFFQEGTGGDYARARYGELRAAANGDVVLVGLRNEALEPMGVFR